MTIAWYRDLFIIVFSGIAALALIFIAVLLYLLWKRLEPILATIDRTAKTMEDIASLIGSPLLRIAPIFQLIASLIEAVIKMFKKQGG